MQITLINHACVKIAIGNATVLCDPWLDGPVFNFGWDLLIKTPMDAQTLMADVTHIWLSHEHPDHFSPKFFNEIAAKFSPKIPVLFQETRDKRVRSFLTSHGFRVIELPDRQIRAVDGIGVICGIDDFYDSWLYLSDGRETVLNLNDCNLSDPAELDTIARLGGPVDVLFTQFSYAAWKGGRANSRLRAQAAANKLAAIAAQTRSLKPRWVVPFASFIYFSSRENDYLNDLANTPDVAGETIMQAGAQAVILYPGDCWRPGEAHDDEPARAAYRRLYGSIGQLPLRGPGDSVPLAKLKDEFESYRRRIFAQNSPVLIRLLRYLPLLDAFRPIRIRLTDLDTLVAVSVVDGFQVAPPGAEDVAMHSSSLSFIFNNPFGYDTLTVNGRFEATPDGFARMTKSLAVGSLNAMGLAVSPKLLLNTRVVTLLLWRLRSVVRGMSQGVDREGPAPAGEMPERRPQ
jgi:UDP-MurNAc hydroxylase